MTLADIASVSSAISGIAVVASLVFLYFQMRQTNRQVEQNSKHTRALIQQGRTDRITANILTVADADLSAAYLIGNGLPATPENIKERQFFLICQSLVRGWEDGFAQFNHGLLSEDQFSGTDMFIARMMVRPGFQKFWADWKRETPGNKKFKAHVDRIAAEAKAASEEP